MLLPPDGVNANRLWKLLAPELNINEEAVDFNQGLRAFYFAFAAIAWFFHPWLSMAGSALVVYILYQREFQSRTLRALKAPSGVSRSLHLPEKGFSELRLNSPAA